MIGKTITIKSDNFLNGRRGKIIKQIDKGLYRVECFDGYRTVVRIPPSEVERLKNE